MVHLGRAGMRMIGEYQLWNGSSFCLKVGGALDLD
jgi:hypothetical protein